MYLDDLNDIRRMNIPTSQNEMSRELEAGHACLVAIKGNYLKDSSGIAYRSILALCGAPYGACDDVFEKECHQIHCCTVFY